MTYCELVQMYISPAFFFKKVPKLLKEIVGCICMVLIVLAKKVFTLWGLGRKHGWILYHHKSIFSEYLPIIDIRYID